MRASAGFVLLSFALSYAQTAPEFRLPDTVRPTSYRLDLNLRPEQPDYSGTVTIDAEVSRAAEWIWLNSKDLKITEAWVVTGGQRVTATSRLEGGEFIGLKPARPVSAGAVQIGLRFAGRLDDKSAVGMYRRQENGRWYIFTTFTAIEARRAFPCFDQPEWKTPWTVTVHVPADLTAVGNARQVSETVEAGGLKRVEFAPTKPLASEVVALGVGPFDIVDDGTAGARNVPVRILAPKGRGSEAAGVLGASKKLLAALESYTGIPYMWDKLDHIALIDMPFGAVENPGLITYRDRSLLAAPERDTPEHRQSIRGTMAHELAHQWFGNLVTQRWWDDVWLSEGFASWLGVKISDLEMPETLRGVAAVRSRSRIMTVDNRPVRLDMHSRKEMGEVYSGIVYQKGAGVLRMLENWLGEETFQRGLRRYLDTHAYGTATTADLVSALSAESKQDVAAVMGGFVNQAGFPTLTAEFDCTARKVRVKPNAGNWQVPVCTRSGCTVAGAAGAELPVSGCPVWANAAGAGYYRLTTPALATLIRSSWEQLTIPEKLDIVESIGTLPAKDQLELLPLAARDRNSEVLASLERLALRLALTPGVDVGTLRKLGW